MTRWLFSNVFWRSESGAVAATYALALVPLVAITGLAFDYTRVAGMDTELQNAADQAALAGASQLDRESGSMERAIEAVQGGLVGNATLFSNDNTGQKVDVPAIGITFFATRTDAEAGDPSLGFTDVSRFAEAGFISVTVETRAANYALTPIVGAMRGEMTANAVAGLGSALCRIPPLMICNPDEENLGSGGQVDATFDFAKRTGAGMLVVAGPGGGGAGFWQPGNFGFLDLGGGAAAVAEGLGWLGPSGGCTSLNGAETIEPDTEPGLKTGAIDSINTRFDIYEANACSKGGVCPSAFNARKDLVRPDSDPTADPDIVGVDAKSCKSANDGWRETEGLRYEPPSAAALPSTLTPASMGHPRDMCHAVSTAGSCTDARFGDGNWDRSAYFRSNFVRADGSRWSETDWQYNVTHGANALTTTTPTRYQVYRWETERAGNVIDGVQILAPQKTGIGTEVRNATPICSQKLSGLSTIVKSPDRRVMTVAVVNCTAEGVKGATKDVKIADWMDVFVVEPSADRTRTSKSDIYLEVIRKTDLSIRGQNNAALLRRDVPYLVR
ncbi:pilus assembly protein [Altererythrobacter sp. SALINAS58]|uniref:TadE/TadG family type IV pilus assembly protein n=1 Tax=Alteripontixanthobacter muriae TaxID=2705546 RepID=UPI001576DDFF|nr:pilus assembly protein TadG-related protein [Alteripontixanthobacter muriae]NTZ41954.1 pilus assembly protein [Alteripontixanthobacter muriae]